MWNIVDTRRRKIIAMPDLLRFTHLFFNKYILICRYANESVSVSFLGITKVGRVSKAEDASKFQYAILFFVQHDAANHVHCNTSKQPSLHSVSAR